MEKSIISKVQKARKKHKNMGARLLYYHLNIKEIGINKFEKIVSNYGLSVKIKRKRIITTDGLYEKSDKNLINGMRLENINQVIAGDITYLILKETTYYIFTLKDMYSKRIIGLYGSDNMKAINAMNTLKQAVRLRGKTIKECIHHTDAGSQYKSNIYKKMLKDNEMKMSIAENCLQNGMAEQLNGVLKNDYLPKNVKDVKDLNKQLEEIKRLINEQKPVKELGYRTPVAFEKWIQTANERPVVDLFDFSNQTRGDFAEA